MWILYAFIASVGIMITEYIYNSASSFWGSFWLLLIPILLSQWALFAMFHGANNIFLAGMVFTFMNAICRIINALLLHQKFGWLTILGLVIVILGGILMKFDK